MYENLHHFKIIKVPKITYYTIQPLDLIYNEEIPNNGELCIELYSSFLPF